MEPRSTRTRLLGWVMLVVTAELLCSMLLEFSKYWGFTFFQIIALVLVAAFILVLHLAGTRIREAYPDLPMFLFFINLILFVALLTVGPHVILSFAKVYEEVMAVLPMPTRFVIVIGFMLRKWFFLPIISAYLFAYLLFLVFTHERLISLQKDLQLSLLLFLSAICFTCACLLDYYLLSGGIINL